MMSQKAQGGGGGAHWPRPPGIPGAGVSQGGLPGRCGRSPEGPRTEDGGARPRRHRGRAGPIGPAEPCGSWRGKGCYAAGVGAVCLPAPLAPQACTSPGRCLVRHLPWAEALRLLGAAQLSLNQLPSPAPSPHPPPPWSPLCLPELPQTAP